MFRPIAPIWGRTVIWEGASRLFLGENYQNTRRLSSQEKTEASDLASATGLTRGMPRRWRPCERSSPSDVAGEEARTGSSMRPSSPQMTRSQAARPHVRQRCQCGACMTVSGLMLRQMPSATAGWSNKSSMICVATRSVSPVASAHPHERDSLHPLPKR